MEKREVDEEIHQTKDESLVGHVLRCGGEHGTQQNCPAIKATCHKCNKKNHYSKMCKTKLEKAKNVHSHEAEESNRNNNSDEESDDSFLIGAVNTQSGMDDIIQYAQQECHFQNRHRD